MNAITHATQRVRNIKKFRSKFGALTSSIAKSVKGWTIVNDHENALSKSYTAPDGNKFNSLGDIEAYYGQKLLEGVYVNTFVEVVKERKILLTTEGARNIQIFRRQFGVLTGSSLVCWKGWSLSHEKRGCKTYTCPDGKKFRSLKQIEAFLGKKLWQGLDITPFINITVRNTSARRKPQNAMKKTYPNRNFSRSRSRGSTDIRSTLTCDGM